MNDVIELPAADLRHLIALYGGAIEVIHGRLVTYREIPPMIRARFTARLAHLDERLAMPRNHDRHAAKAAITLCLAMYELRFQQDKKACELVVASYVAALKSFPSWAIGCCCHRWITGASPRSGKGRAPSVDQLGAELRDYLAPFYAEQWQLERLLNARPEREPTEAEKAYVAEGLRKLRASLAEHAAALEASDQVRSAAATGPRNARYSAYARPQEAVPSDPVSEELAALVGRDAPQAAPPEPISAEAEDTEDGVPF